MGNILKENILDIWGSQKYKKFRNDYKNRVNNICNTKCKFTKDSKIYIKEFNFQAN